VVGRSKGQGGGLGEGDLVRVSSRETRERELVTGSNGILLEKGATQ